MDFQKVKDAWKETWHEEEKCFVPARTSCTVVIPAHNEAECIVDTVSSILKQSRLPDLVVVVDDGSSDGTGDLVRQNFKAGVIVLTPLKNLGSKAKAQNFALNYKKTDRSFLINTDTVVTIDADTTLKQDALEKMLVEMDKDPSISVACGTVIPANPDNPYTLGRLGEYLYAFMFPKAIQNALGRNIYIASGCFGCYRLDLLRKFGGWHETTMAEDMDLTARFQSMNLKPLYVQNAICYPIEPFNWKTYKAQMIRWSAAFFQNVSLHWRDYLTKPFGVFVGASFLDALIGSIEFLLVLPLMTIFVWGWQKTLLGFLLWDLLPISFFVILGGIRFEKLKEAVLSIPFTFFLRILNIFFWWQALIREWILKKPLTVYVKGH